MRQHCSVLRVADAHLVVLLATGSNVLCDGNTRICSLSDIFIGVPAEQYPPTVRPNFYYRAVTWDPVTETYIMDADEDKSTDETRISPHDRVFEFLKQSRDFDRKIAQLTAGASIADASVQRALASVSRKGARLQAERTVDTVDVL